MSQPDRHRPDHPDRGARQDHHPARRRRARSPTPSSTSPSSAASSGSSRAGPIHEMPSIMARICGICPVSHLIASSKACDEILAVEPPPTGADLRRVMNLAQIVQSNALSFFHLSSPDLLFGFDADPAEPATSFGVAAGQSRSWPATGSGSAGSASRSSSGSAASGSTRPWVVPGGVDAPLAAETRDRILADHPRGDRRHRAGARLVQVVARALGGRGRLVRRLPVGVHGPRRRGRQRRLLRRLAAGHGRRRAAARRPRRPARLPGLPGRGRRALVVPQVDLLEGRSATPTASTGSARWPGSSWPTRWARRAPTRSSSEFRRRLGRVPSSSFHYHYARLIDTLHCPERIEELLRGPGHPLAAGALARRHQPRTRASASPRRRAARSSTTTGSTTTASSSGPTWSSPPATTTWP